MQRIRHVGKHPLQRLDRGATAQQHGMPLGKLTDQLDVVQGGVELADHVVDVARLLEEAEAALERHAGDHVERVPLHPGRQVDRRALARPHRRYEDARARVRVRLVVAHVGHAEQRRHGPFQRSVRLRVALREDARHLVAFVPGGHGVVEIGLE